MLDACFFILSPYLPGLRPMPIAAQCQVDAVSQLLLYEYHFRVSSAAITARISRSEQNRQYISDMYPRDTDKLSCFYMGITQRLEGELMFSCCN